MLTRKEIEQLDSQRMLSSIEVLDKQCEEAWNATKATALPDSYKKITNIVWFGMGGSALGIDIVNALYATQLTTPITVVNDYQVPATLTNQSLAILSSYSGTTEEVVQAAEQVMQRTKQVYIMCTGGALADIAQQHQLPAYIFSPTNNPSNQPRMAVGYSVMGTLGILNALGVLHIEEQAVSQVTAFIRSLHAQFGADAEAKTNTAKQLASALQPHIPVLISAEHLVGSTHVFANQLNENSKQFSVRFPIPELNHHLIEGLQFPQEALQNLHAVFFTSALYNRRNQKRFTVTQRLFEQHHVPVTTIALHSATPLEQVFELLTMGSYASLYLAILHGIDPSPIPNIDALKKALKDS